MRKLAWIALFAGLASACGSPPPSNVAPVGTAKPVLGAAPAPTTPEPETPDAAFRYVPPDPVTARSALPTPVDFTLANGMPVRFLEMRKSPVVTAVVIVRWKTLAKVPGTAGLFGSGFFRLKLPSGLSLMEELEKIGARAWATTDQDATYLRLSTLKDSVEPAFSLIITALRSGKLDAAGLERARDFVKRDLEDESPSARTDRVSDAQLFPASHRYHEPSAGTLDAISKLKADDLHRFRDAALAPEGVSFGVAGSISKADLAAALDRVLGSWTAKPPAKPKALSKKEQEVIPPGMTHAVFVTEEPSGKLPQAIVSIPMPNGTKSDFASALVAWGVLVERAAQRLRDASPDGKSHLDSHMRPRALGRTLLIYAEAIDGHPAVAAENILKAMDDVVKGDFPDRDVTYVRRARSLRSSPGDGLESLLWFLADEITSGAAPGVELFLSDAIDAAPRDEIVRAAGVYFKRDRVSVVIDGGARSDKDAFEKLGAGPFTFVPAPKKGAKK